MLCTVLHHGVPIGTVELGDRELAAGTMSPTKGYAGIRPIIQAGSEALLQLGFFGAAAQTRPADSTALAAAAALTFELADAEGRDVPATFVNLIEAPEDDRVVVLARRSHASAAVAADLGPRRERVPDVSRLE